jgi:hypothetical protein
MSRSAIALLCPLLLALGACRAPAPVPAAARATEGSPARAEIVIEAPPADWRALLGRRVRIDAPLTVSGNHRLDDDGTLVASFGGRLYAPTERAAPGAEAARIAADNARRRLLLALPPEADAAPAQWRSGSVIDGVEGVVEQADGAIRLRVAAAPRVRAATRPPPPAVAGDVRIASLNLENLFNGDGRGGGFPTARGAETPAAYARQLGKLVATLRALDPDIAALMELENDGYGADSSLAQLVAALNAGDTGDWRYVDAGSGPGDDAIRVALIYRGDRVEATGRAATLTGEPFGDLSRAPLAQAFRAGRGPVFTVVANHFKSKNCGEATGGNRDQGDGQACWNATRRESARRLAAWLETDPTRSGSDLAAILGDLNAYAQEAPVQLLRDAEWRDALAGVTAPYSYVYDGQAGRLDHALLSPALAARLAGAAEWHSNADEAENVGEQPGNGGDHAQPWRSSDHDPLLLGLHLRTPAMAQRL